MLILRKLSVQAQVFPIPRGKPNKPSRATLVAEGDSLNVVPKHYMVPEQTLEAPRKSLALQNPKNYILESYH